jgi:ribonuclease P/MRP protein subunit RPP40
VHLKNNNLISRNQHGFLPRRSCTTLHMQIINDWHILLDQNSGGHIHVISLDWEKAFDKIPHQRLLLKLRNNCISGPLLAWFSSYLKNRKQRVLCGGQFSDLFPVPSGVIQGSVLGRLLFNIFVSDLPSCVTSNLIMYADDSTIYRHIQSFDDERKLQEDLASIFLWSANNGMNLNVAKCMFMDVTLSSRRRFGKYEINNIPLEHADHIKMLGVYISFNLSWNIHVDYLRSKTAKLLGFVSRNLRECSPKVKCQSYQCLIRPILMHAIPGWHPTTKENILKLQRIQNRASRFVFGKENTHELDKRIMSVKNYHCFIDSWYFYQCRSNMIDSRVTDLVRTGRPIRGENGTCKLIPPKTRTSMYKSGFVFRSVMLWNSVPAYIRLMDVRSIKNGLYTHFLTCP